MSFDISRSTFRPAEELSRRRHAAGPRPAGLRLERVASRILAPHPGRNPRHHRPRRLPRLDAKCLPDHSRHRRQRNNTLTIGAGRYYVDGLLAENHGPETAGHMGHSARRALRRPLRRLDTTAHYRLHPAALPTRRRAPTGNGPCLAYLDVWQRDVTYLEDPAPHRQGRQHRHHRPPSDRLAGQAARSQQLPRRATGCSRTSPPSTALSRRPDGSPMDSSPTPPPAHAASRPTPATPARRTSSTASKSINPERPPRRRRAVHLPAAPNTPTFKWSRDNASVATSVSAISTVTTSTGP